MTTKSGQGDHSPERFSLRRWSRRKLEAARAAPSAAPAPATPPVAVSEATPQPAALAPAPLGTASPTPAELPPVTSLTFDSDFTAFLQPQVDEAVKRAALKQLFRDPRFNVMDGLDTYIGDYTQADPIPSEMLQDLMRRGYIYNPPATEADEGVAADQASASDHALATDAPGTTAGAPAAAPLADNPGSGTSGAASLDPPSAKP